MLKKTIVISILVILVGTMLVPNLVGAQETITFAEFLADRDANGNFTSYEPDDIVQIEDTIAFIDYNDDTKETKIWLDSTGSSVDKSTSLTFISDKIQSSYKENEKVKITFKIVLDETTNTEDYYYDLESIEHITFVEVDEKEDGLDLFGYTVDLPEQLDNNYGRFLIYVLFWIIIGAIVLFVLDPVIRGLTRKTKSKIDDMVLDIIRKPVLALIILYGIVQSLSALELSEDILFYVQQVYNIGFFIVIIWLIYKILNVILIQVGRAFSANKKVNVEKILVPAFQKLITVLIFIFAMLTILGYLGIDLTMLALGGMIISMVIAFAAQDTLSNFFAGMFLIIEPDFKEGDWVIIDNTVYDVRHIGMRNTKLYDLKEHMMVVMPNSLIANNKIINLTEPD
ncbi:MAG: mechanosensitive ion channel, partial [Thermoplasmata archaeon]|nr:mechanosensitive ion channel [Thermoplasmata archaeon]